VDIVLMQQSQAFMIQMFLDNTCSQLMYHGLFTLASLPAQTASILEPTSSPSLDSAATETTPPLHAKLFALFRNSHLKDVDQVAATFINSSFEHAAPIGGDWASLTLSPEALGMVNPSEYVLHAII
jgi:ubiquitin carboxyl-terminal hydrolase MINDY-1/2